MLKEVWDVVQGAEAWPGVTVAPIATGCVFRSAARSSVTCVGRENRSTVPGGNTGSTRGRGIGQSRSDHPDVCRIVFVVRTLGMLITRYGWFGSLT